MDKEAQIRELYDKFKKIYDRDAESMAISNEKMYAYLNGRLSAFHDIIAILNGTYEMR